MRTPSTSSVTPSHSESVEEVSRRVILQGGLVGLASALASAHLLACSEDPSRTAGSSPLDMMGDEGPHSMGDHGLTGEADMGEPLDMAELPDMDEVRDMAELTDMADMTSPVGGEPVAEVDMITEGLPPADFPRRTLPSPPALSSEIDSIGPLLPPDENGLRLPEGFSSRVIARSGQPVGDTDYRWHPAPDGGATYPTEDGGWIYVSNSEVRLLGGVSAVRFNASGELVDAYSVLSLTDKNCAGGATPWHTWLSCEETSTGQVYECSPWGDRDPILRPALGTFKHEAVAVDPRSGLLYLTEDEGDGGLYRFTATQNNADGHPHLEAGLLEVASVSEDGRVSWYPVPDPLFTGELPTRRQVPEMTSFDGGEGIWYFNDVIYFSTKGDNRVWAYHIGRAQVEVIYDGRGHLSGVDNLTVSCCGDVLVAEDGGDMEIVAIASDGSLKTLVQVEGQEDSEITGPAFDPSGTRLYFSSQRGPTDQSSDGITYEVTGPFHRLV